MKRLQFDFTPEAVAQLDDLKKTTKAPSRAELVRRALRFYAHIARMEDDGYKVQLSKGDDKQTLPPLSVI